MSKTKALALYVPSVNKNLVVKRDMFFDPSKLTNFDFFDKKRLHFDSPQFFQFNFRLNYSFDCFLLALHYNLYLTYNLFYLHFGFGIKTRLRLPFYKFYR